MKKVFTLVLSVWFVAWSLILPGQAAFAKPASPALAPQTYNVLVGAEVVKRGIGLMAFFPETVYIHAGDKVHWAINSHEIHTVTFLGGNPLPDLLVPVPNGPQGAMMINPMAAFPVVPSNGHYDGSYINSGLMSSDPGQITSFDLVFDQAGTYSYVCIVHGQMMSGKVVVVNDSQSIPSPDQVSRSARLQIKRMVAHANHLRVLAQASVPKPATNLVVVQPQPSGPSLLLLNPAIALPANAGQPLTRQGIYNSGILDPSAPGPHSVEWKIGDIQGRIDYLCLLHDTSGMVASLYVLPAIGQ